MAALRADLAAADAADGWDPEAGAPHPTGGHTRRAFDTGTTEGGLRWARSRLYAPDAGGHEVIHCADAPSLVEWTWRDGEIALVRHRKWHQGGDLHRGSAPAAIALVGQEGEVTRYYYWRGEITGAVRVHSDASDEMADRCLALIAAGAEPEQVNGWLHQENKTIMRLENAERAGAPRGRRTTKVGERVVAQARARSLALIAAGVGAQQVLDLAAQKVFDVDVVIAVAAGELPLSWAIAGA